MQNLVALIVVRVEVGLVWAMVWSWQLTWVGMAMAALSAGLWRCRQVKCE